MDLRQISYFVALVEEGSVTRAAQRMNVVQPALSMQIAKLERELDQRLFDRQPKAMVPTAAGRTLHRLVQPILRDVAEARATMARLSGSVSGRVNVGILSSLAMSVVPSVLARFSATYPQVELSLADGYSSTFVEGVGNGSLDLAVINKPPHRVGLLVDPLLDEEMVVVGGRDTPLPIPVPVRMRDLTEPRSDPALAAAWAAARASTAASAPRTSRSARSWVSTCRRPSPTSWRAPVASRSCPASP
ncbi:LysR family transcriptional regulator [Methylobacterium sp. P31]